MQKKQKTIDFYISTTPTGEKTHTYKCGQSFTWEKRNNTHDSSNVEDFYPVRVYRIPLPENFPKKGKMDARIHYEMLRFKGVMRAKKGKEIFVVPDLSIIDHCVKKFGGWLIKQDEASLAKLRNYQKLIVLAVKTFLDGDLERGQVYSATGSGKTECFLHTIGDLLVDKEKPKKILLVYPRLRLSNEQLTRVQNAIGREAKYFKFDSDRGTKAALETTDAQKLKEQIEHWSGAGNTNVITLTTYHSMGKLAGIEFDVIIFDEAHNAVSDKRMEAINTLNTKKCIFYTATPIVDEMYSTKGVSATIIDEDGEEVPTCRGMNNPDKFGKPIIEIPASYLISLGWIARPLIHHLDLKTELNYDENSKANPAHCIGVAFKHQYKDTRFGGKKGNNLPYCRMLATMGHTEDIKYIIEHIDEVREKLGDEIKESVDVFTTDTNNGQTFNGGKFDGDFTERLRKHTGNYIVCHWGQLGEGIDIPSLTGSVPFRDLNPAQGIQFNTRSGRIDPIDCVNGKYKPIEQRQKMYNIITIPTIGGKPVSISKGTSKFTNLEDLIKGFASAGYGEITSYMTKEFKKTLTEKCTVCCATPCACPESVVTPPGTVRENPVYRAIIEDRLKKEFTAFKEIFETDSSEEQIIALADQFNKIDEDDLFAAAEAADIKHAVKLDLLQQQRDNAESSVFKVRQGYIHQEIAKDLTANRNPDANSPKYHIVEYDIEEVIELKRQGIPANQIVIWTKEFCQGTQKWAWIEGCHYVSCPNVSDIAKNPLRKRQARRSRTDLLAGQTFKYKRFGKDCHVSITSNGQSVCKETGKVFDTMNKAFSDYFIGHCGFSGFTINAWWHPKNSNGECPDQVLERLA